MAFHWTVAGGDVDAAFKNADVVVKERIVQQRLIPTAMEPRAALAQWSAGDRRADALEHDAEPAHRPLPLLGRHRRSRRQAARRSRRKSAAGSAARSPRIPGDFITVFCAMKLGRPVKWTETRSENYQATTHGRDHVQDVELAATKDGTILGLRCTVWAGMGAYLSTAAPGIPTILHGLMLSGPYNVAGGEGRRLRRLHQHDAGRGVSRRRPSRSDVHARAHDRQARATSSKIDPVEVRRRNLIPPFDNGHTVVTGLTYDSGNYQARARQGARPRRLRRRSAPEQAEARKQGPVPRHRRRDLRRDLRPRPVAGRRRRRLPGRPLGKRDRPLPSDRQGARLHRRVAARPGRRDDVRADRRRRARRRRQRREGRARRHRQHADGLGHLRQPHDRGRRRGAGAGRRARSRRRRSCSRAHLLEAAVEDIDYADGKFFVKGSPDKSQDDSGHRADGQRRVEHAAGHGGRARGDELLRPAELRVSVRRARRGRRSRSGDRARRAEALRRASTTAARRSTR